MEDTEWTALIFSLFLQTPLGTPKGKLPAGTCSLWCPLVAGGGMAGEGEEVSTPFYGSGRGGRDQRSALGRLIHIHSLCHSPQQMALA